MCSKTVKPRKIFLSSNDHSLQNNDVLGKYFQEEYFEIHVKKNADIFLDDVLICSFRKSVIQNSKTYQCLETNIIKKFIMSDHRRVATGVVKKRVTVPSGVFGYYDKLTPQMKTQLGGIHIAGRKTSFVKHYPDKWKNMIPIFQKCNNLYKKTCPNEFKIQSDFCKSIEKNLLIPNTVFSTVTINKNFRTCTHTDKGDFMNGLSVLLITGKHFKGGCLGFPRLKLLIHCKEGDIVFMNSHEPHCNTNIQLKDIDDSFRYSIVCYVRTNMDKFHTPRKVNDEIFYVS